MKLVEKGNSSTFQYCPLPRHSSTGNSGQWLIICATVKRNSVPLGIWNSVPRKWFTDVNFVVVPQSKLSDENPTDHCNTGNKIT